MADLLPDVPADLWNSWSADQFAQAAQEKIATIPSDISTGVQNLLAPPEQPSTAPPTEPAPAPEPPPEAAPTPEPTPLPPPPAPEAPPAAPPADMTAQPAPLPDLSTPPPDVSAVPPPDVSAPPDVSTPPPPPVPSAPPTPAGGGGDSMGQLLGAADAAGADMSQFTQALGQHMSSAGGNLIGAALGAADAAGADMGQFTSQLGNFSSQLTAAPQQAVQTAQQSLGIQGPQPNAPGDWIDQARQAAQQAGIDPDIFARQIQQESGFNPTAKSGAGALGIAQFMPGTAQGMGIDPMDPVQALAAAARMDAQNLQQYGGDWGKTLAAYNAGPGNVAKYGGVPPFAETQTYVQNILGGAKNVVQQAADDGVQAVNSVGQAAQSAAARTSQFGMGLSPGDAMAFCGPAAAMAFAQTFGRNPTVQEAEQLAQQVGWNAGQGMAGPSSEVALLNKMGIDTHMTQGVNWTQVASDASSGNPVIIDTPGHYFYVQGYNADTGQFNLGSSATDLKAAKGQEWFTPDQISNLGMGDPRAAIFADHPLSPGGVASAVGGAASNVLSGAQDFTGALGQKAQDTLDAVVSTGVSTLQDAQSTVQGGLSNAQQGLTSALMSDPGQALMRAGVENIGDPSIIPAGSLDIERQLNAAKNQWLAQNNPLGDQSLAGTLTSGLAQQLTDPAFLAMLPLTGGLGGAASDLLGGGIGGGIANQAVQGALLNAGGVAGQGGDLQDALTALLTGGVAGGVLGGVGEAAPRLGQAASTILSDPAVQAALTSRLPAQAEVNAALGGLPQVFGIGGAQPLTGVGQLQRALDALGAYPDEVAGPIRQFASGVEDVPPSQVASTIFRWMSDNPLHQMPDVTQPATVARDVGQQAVSDIADAVLGRRASLGGGAAGYLPAGQMPGQLGLLPEQPFQPGLPQGSGAGGVPTGGLTAGEQGWLQNLMNAAAQRDFGGMQAALEQGGLLGSRESGLSLGGQAAVPGFESQIRGFDASGALQQPAQTADAALTAWAQRMAEQGAASGGAQPSLPGGQGMLEDLLNQITSPASATAATPNVLQQALGAPGATASRLGSFIASALSPTENLPAPVRSALEDFAATVGHNSQYANVIANLQAQANGYAPEVEQRMAQGLRTQATNDLLQRLQDLKLAAPVGSDPAAPGFTAPKGQGWQLASTDAGSPLSRWVVHPDVQGPINAVVGRSWLADNPFFGSLLKAGGVGKGTIFSLSNFHTYTELLNTALSSPRTAIDMAHAFASDSFSQGLRGKLADSIGNAAKAGVTGMLDKAAPDVGGDIAQAGLRRAIAGGVGGLGGGASGYYEAKLSGKSDQDAWNQAKLFGAAGAGLAGFPMVAGGRGTVAEELSQALWARAVPVAKASVWQALTDGGMEARTAAQVTNERFGGLNYAMMGRNPTLQDAMRLGVMAPDWGESTVRQMGRLLGGPATGEARGFVGKAVGGMLLTTQLLNYALSGHSTLDNQPGHQFEVEVKDPAGGFSHTGLIPGNFLSYLNLANKLTSDPAAKRQADVLNALTGHMAALPATAADLARTGASSSVNQPYGYNRAGLAAVLQNLAPIGVSQVAQGINAGGEDPATTILKALIGLNPRYTNPTTGAGTAPSPGSQRGPVTVAPVPMSSVTSQPIKVQPVKER